MYNKITELLKTSENAALCIITQTKGSTPRKVGSKMLVYNSGKIEGTIGGGTLEKKVIEDALQILKTGEPNYFHHNLLIDHNMGCGGTVDIYIEPILKKKKLYIFGGGHVGKSLGLFAYMLNFDVVVIDDRSEIFETWDKEKFELINRNHTDILPEIDFNENSFVTIMSYTHEIDRDVTAYCAKQNLAYLGLISSTRKVKKFTDYYLENKILTQQQIDKIDMPMGVKINCETPEEIAISILAKLIDVRGKKNE